MICFEVPRASEWKQTDETLFPRGKKKKPEQIAQTDRI